LRLADGVKGGFAAERARGPLYAVEHCALIERAMVAIIVLGNAQWPVLRLHVARVVAAVNAATPGSFTEIDIPTN
jgi:hypothetical protein